VMTEWIANSTDAPAVGLLHIEDDGGSAIDGALECGIGIVGGEDDANGSSLEGFRAEVLEVGSLVCDPEGGSIDGEVADDSAVFSVVTEDLLGSEGCFVEVDGLCSVAYGEKWDDCGRGGNVRHVRSAPMSL